MEIYKFMSKHIHYFYTIALLGITIALIISYHNNDVLENRLCTTNKVVYDEINSSKLTSEKSFKEDYYITQQSSDTNLILCCIGIGFVVFSFFTYQSVVATMASEVSRMKENYTAHENKYDLQHKKLIKLEVELKHSIAESYSDEADKALSREPIDINSFIGYQLLSCEKYSEVLLLCEDENQRFKNSLYRTIIHSLESLNKNIVEFHDFINVEPARHKKRIRNIQQIIKDEDSHLFHSVFAKIRNNYQPE